MLYPFPLFIEHIDKTNNSQKTKLRIDNKDIKLVYSFQDQPSTVQKQAVKKYSSNTLQSSHEICGKDTQMPRCVYTAKIRIMQDMVFLVTFYSTENWTI